MEIIHENDINDISECNLIYDILNISKCKKYHYYPILHGCMNARRGREKFKNMNFIRY